VRIILRYIENRKVIISKEVERKIEEIISDLFLYKED